MDFNYTINYRCKFVFRYMIAYYNRAVLRTEINDVNRAIEDFSMVLKLNPLDYRTLYNRAILYKNMFGKICSFAYLFYNFVI